MGIGAYTQVVLSFPFAQVLLLTCQPIHLSIRITMNNNRVTLIGYVGNDITCKTLADGSKRVAIRMATHYPVKKDKGQIHWNTVWHDLVAWDSTAGFAERNFVKGSKIMAEGTIEYRSFPDKKGHIRYITQIRAISLANLDR